MRDKVIVSWSGGKDSALALYEVIKDGALEPVGLLTTVTEGYDRVSMHGVRRSLIERQASALGMPLHLVYIPKNCSNEKYAAIMRRALCEYREKGVKGFVFGDIFLEDVRKYREESLLSEGFRGYFPIWKRNTRDLVRKFIELKFKAITTCIDGEKLDLSFVGQNLDEKFLQRLPASVDPAGENGEYHCFVYDGPLFNKAIPVSVGRIVKRGKFYYCDLLPVNDKLSARVTKKSLRNNLQQTHINSGLT